MTLRNINNAYIADTARVIGEVELGEGVSVWYGAVIRGDVAKITIGEQTNIQDGAVVHCDHDVPMTIGKRVTIGHNAVVHGKSVGDDALIGMGAIVLGETTIGEGAIIAAGAVVPPGMEVPAGMLAVGVPAKVVREVTEEQCKQNRWNAQRYVELAKQHIEQGEDDLHTHR